MVVHKSLFGAGRLGARRRSAPTTRLGACSYTCRARGAQALRCYKPPHGGKTTRGRAFVVGIGHPRRELSPGRWYRAWSRRDLRSCRAFYADEAEERDAFLVPRGLSPSRIPTDIRRAETSGAIEKCAVDLGIPGSWFCGTSVSDRAEVQFATSEEMGIYPSWCARVLSDWLIRAHGRVRERCLLLEDGGAARNRSPGASGADVDFILSRLHPQAWAGEWENCLGKQKLRATESVAVSNFNFHRPPGRSINRVFDCSIARWNQPTGRISMLSPELRRAALNPDRAAKVGWKYRGSATNAASNRPATRINVPARFKVNHGHAKISTTVGGTIATGRS